MARVSSDRTDSRAASPRHAPREGTRRAIEAAIRTRESAAVADGTCSRASPHGAPPAPEALPATARPALFDPATWDEHSKAASAIGGDVSLHGTACPR